MWVLRKAVHERSAVLVGQNGGTPPHRHTVLIVEDDADTRAALTLIVKQEGYEVVIASSGCKALAVLSRGLRPCAILLDLEMPKWDGFAFRRGQMKEPELSDIPLLVVSAGGYFNEAEARKLGMTTFFRKPVDLDAFLRAVGQHS